MKEIFKSMNGLSPPLVRKFHESKHVTYNLRIQNLCMLPPIRTMNVGLDLISFRGGFLWNTLDELDALVKYVNNPPHPHVYAYIISFLGLITCRLTHLIAL